MKSKFVMNTVPGLHTNKLCVYLGIEALLEVILYLLQQKFINVAVLLLCVLE